nr:hypothetical protein [uncultured Holophaga sp.]
MKEPYRGYHSLKEELSQPGITIVAEVAGGNPLRGQVRENFRASTHAKSLVENGANALAVATDRFLYFGDDRNLPEVRPLVKVPVLRRDFILEEYQVEESKILGADAIFLVAALLETERLSALHKLALSKGLDVVVEVSSEADLARALEAGAEIVCVVGRDLDTWESSWELALELIAKVPEKQCLRMVEAGIHSLDQISQIEALGVHGVIIGDVLLDEFYPGKRLAQILSGVEVARKTGRSRSKGGTAEADPELSADPLAENGESAAASPRKAPAKKAAVAKKADPTPVPDSDPTPAKTPAKKTAVAKKADPTPVPDSDPTPAKTPAKKTAVAKKADPTPVPDSDPTPAKTPAKKASVAKKADPTPVPDSGTAPRKATAKKAAK